MASRRAYTWKVTMLAKLFTVLRITLRNYNTIFKSIQQTEEGSNIIWLKYLLFSYLNLSVFP